MEWLHHGLTNLVCTFVGYIHLEVRKFSKHANIVNVVCYYAAHPVNCKVNIKWS